MAPSASKIAVVIGANRGIGLSLCGLSKQHGYTVYGAGRKATPELQKAEVHIIEGVDMAADNATAPILAALAGKHIDLLIISAGYQELDKLSNVTRDTIQRQMDVNAYGPLFAVQALQCSLSKAAKVVLISSKMASITEVNATNGDLYGYRMSKAALNMAGVVLARDLKANDSPVALIHPGVVNTQMYQTLQEARNTPLEKRGLNTLTPDESAAKIWSLIQDLNLENTGSFWAADTGKIIGW
ncbi:hypothetical protein WJX72_006409 [[Myrmecia] bisecta]|uniref:Uncharacterized protein n=1 Tax=[Myrmecia] bisecta TaxID=41462 RepID=A0AAW1QFX5_9CHLO